MAQHSDEEVTVFDRAQECFLLFQRTLDVVQAAQEVAAWTNLRDEYGRLKLWSSNIGALPPQVHISLDYKLKDLPEARDLISDHLEVLIKRLKQILRQYEGATPLDRQTETLTIGDSDRTRQNWKGFHPPLSAIHDHIGWLYRLSNSVEKASTTRRNVADTNESESLLDERVISGLYKLWLGRMFPGLGELSISLSDLQAEVIDMNREPMKLLLPNVSKSTASPKTTSMRNLVHQPQQSQEREWLFTRLIATMCQRRSRIIQRQKRNERKHFASLRDAQNQDQDQSLASARLTDIVSGTTFSKNSTVKLSGSSFRRALESSYHSNTSNYRTDNHDTTILPPMPDVTDKDEFICPYCCFILNVRQYHKKSAWLEHVTHDIEPFVCLFNPCSSATLTYASTKDWKAHMRSEHLLRWKCPYIDHDDEVYQNSEGLKIHLREQHQDENYKEDDIELIVENSTLPAAHTFEACPFCSISSAEFGYDHAMLERHVAAHLQYIAYLSTLLLDGVELRSNEDDFNSVSVDSNTERMPRARTTIREYLETGDQTYSELHFEDELRSVVESDELEIVSASATPYIWDTVFATLGRTNRHVSPSIEEQLEDSVLSPFIKNSYELQDIRLQLQANSQTGLRIASNESGTVIPYYVLEREQFSNEALLRRLLACGRGRVQRLSVAHYKQHFLRMLYILLNIGRLDAFDLVMAEGLSDTALPLNKTPLLWKNSPEAWESFEGEQWRFYIPTLPPLNRETMGVRQPFIISMPQKSFLPVKDCAVIVQTAANITYKVSLYRTQHDDDVVESRLEKEMNTDEEPNNRNEPEFLILKVFIEDTNYARKSFVTELQAHEMIAQHDDDWENVRQCFGAIMLAESGLHDIPCLVLEYADLGSLEDYVRHAEPPAYTGGVIALWSRLIRLVKTVAQFHELRDENGILESCHHDITLRNVLVFSGPNDLPIFKLADFGRSSFARVKSQHMWGEEFMTTTAFSGTRSYGPPETASQITVGQRLDVWSLGCILSVFASFMILGPRGVRDFQGRRINAEKRSSSVPLDSFHDGHAVLSDVLEWNERLMAIASNENLISADIVRLVISAVLLTDSNSRISASQLSSELTDLVSEAIDLASTLSPDTSPHARESITREAGSYGDRLGWSRFRAYQYARRRSGKTRW